MPVKDKQILITAIVSKILSQKAEQQSFSWLINNHNEQCFKQHFRNIENIFTELNGKECEKAVRKLQPDAYFGGKYNFLFEFDEVQHFSSARLSTFKHYPKNLKLNYPIETWVKHCNEHYKVADKYRNSKSTKDFNFEGGRTCQRAYLDCFRDFVPPLFGLNPTLRIAECEVKTINTITTEGIKQVEKIIKERMKFI